MYVLKKGLRQILLSGVRRCVPTSGCCRSL